MKMLLALKEETYLICSPGVDEMSWDDLSKNEMQWPSLQEVKTMSASHMPTVYSEVEIPRFHQLIICTLM